MLPFTYVHALNILDYNLINTTCGWETFFSYFQEHQNSKSYHNERKAQVGRKKAQLPKIEHLLDIILERIE